MIDLHAHVLPGIDDGPADMDGSVELARAAAAEGIRSLVATPHVTRRYPTGAAAMRTGVAAVTSRLQAERIPLTVRTGSEIDVVWAVELDDEELYELRLGDGPWLLAECPLSMMAAGTFDLLVRGLQARGHEIVLAHPERSPVIRRRPDLLRTLVADGMLSSITAGSLVGQFGREVRDFSAWLLEQGLVHNVTSDAHDARRRRPELRSALTSVAESVPAVLTLSPWLTHDVPDAVLEGRDIPPRPASAVAGPTRRRAARWRRAGSG